MRPLSQNLVELVKLLSDAEYHDGTSIGNHLNISRAAVWKAIKKLEQYKVPLTCTKGKGYKLESPLVLLDSNRLKSQLRHRSIKLEVLEKIPSTNDYLKLFSKNNKAIIACFSEAQTSGKGRLQRQWHSPFADNIYLSVLCPFEKDISELCGLSLVAALAVCCVIDSKVALCEKKLTVKWPNDILIDGDKVAGVLVEIEAESHGFCQVIIGIGVNVNMHKTSKKEINQTWTALSRITHRYMDRNTLCPDIIDTLMDYLERFSSKGLASFKQEWQKRDGLANSMISVLSGIRVSKGTCLGINDQGHLKVKTETGDTLILSSGDTTLLK